MRTRPFLIGAGILLLFTACSSPSHFPFNGGQVLHSESQFGVLTAQPDVYRGQAIKFAGRIVTAETTAQGTLVLADWLPYPKVESDGPKYTGEIPQGRFTVFYPGSLDADGSLYGNVFLAVGKMKGIQSKTILRDAPENLPIVTARCLHVWKTGDSEIEPLDNEYFVMEETYCAES